jgi:hypothetical protein
VNVFFNGHNKMYLHTGWEKFARFHDLQAGCVLTFLPRRREMSVKVFDDTSCHRHYHDDYKEDDDCSFFTAKMVTEVSVCSPCIEPT